MQSNPDKIAVLGYIQNIISRLGQNSFLVKGWSASIVALIGTLLEKNNYTFRVMLVVCITIFVFWFLNALYLYNEKAFRKLYQYKALDTADDTSIYVLDIESIKGCKCTRLKYFWSTFISPTVFPFHGILFFCAVAIYFYK